MRASVYSIPFLLVVLVLSAPAQATAWHVPSQIPSIWEAMDYASAGDTVLVACGIYSIGWVEMKSGVVLRGETSEAGCVTLQHEMFMPGMRCDYVEPSATNQGFNFVSLPGGGLGLIQATGGNLTGMDGLY